MEPSIKKPCIKQCCLDEKDVCLGCFRTLDDMLVWHKSTDSQKHEILVIASKRKRAHKEKHKGGL